MAQSSPLILRILASSVTAANRAGKIIRDIMNRGDLGIVEKGKGDLQTEADRSAQKCIVASLSQQFPKVTIIGEEGDTQCEVPSDWIVTDCEPEILSKQCPKEYLQVTSDDIVVWVDPLDGTAEFTQGLLDHVTVLIGVAVKGKAVGGVIHQPYYNYKTPNGSMGRTIWGLKGLGVGGIKFVEPPAGKFIVTTTRRQDDLVQKTLDAVQPDEVLRVGGCGHKILMLIEGEAHAYVFASKGCKKWDTCAPEAVLETLGGVLTDLHGNHYDYNNIYCYYASWGAWRPGNAKVASDNLDPNLCTHIYYAFLNLQSNGSLTVLDHYLDIDLGNIQKLSNLKQVNPNLKLVFSIGGATAAPNVFIDVFGDPAVLQIFVQSCIDYLQQYNFDGFDIDWEYPTDKAMFINALKAMRQGFDPHGYMITTAVAYNPDDAAYDVPAMNEVLDVINVMTYDFHTAFAGKTGQNSPLYASSSETDWQKNYQNDHVSILNWKNAGASPEKLALGAGFYGHTFLLTNPDDFGLGAPVTGPADKGPYTSNAGTLGYAEICEFHPNGQVIWDDEQKVPYMHEGNLWIGYDNEQSVREKVKYVKDNGLAGIMIWSIETDDVVGACGQPWTLLKAINDEMKN